MDGKKQLRASSVHAFEWRAGCTATALADQFSHIFGTEFYDSEPTVTYEAPHCTVSNPPCHVTYDADIHDSMRSDYQSYVHFCVHYMYNITIIHRTGSRSASVQ